jgi:hypothetical protein
MNVRKGLAGKGAAGKPSRRPLHPMPPKKLPKVTPRRCLLAPSAKANQAPSGKPQAANRLHARPATSQGLRNASPAPIGVKATKARLEYRKPPENTDKKRGKLSPINKRPAKSEPTNKRDKPTMGKKAISGRRIIPSIFDHPIVPSKSPTR